MAKRFKIRLSLPSFQICRSKEISSSAQSPLPKSFMFSPFNAKALDIAYPIFPNPPPTPDHPLSKHNVPSTALPVRSDLQSRSCKTYMTAVFNFEPLNTEDSSYLKEYNSPVSDDSDSSTPLVVRSRYEKNKSSRKKPKGRLGMNTSAEKTTGRFSSDEQNEETESLVSSFPSSVSSDDFAYKSKTSRKKPSDRSKRNKNNVKVGRSKQYASTRWMDSGEIRAGIMQESVFPVKKPAMERLVSCMADGKVNESYVIVKRSRTPCEDFKRSMLEMAVEKEMFEAKDLEQLLFCFLSLNSRHHHTAIVDAFTEIWVGLFSQTPES